MQPALVLTPHGASDFANSDQTRAVLISAQRMLPLSALLALASCQSTVNPASDPLSIFVEPATLTLIAGHTGTLLAYRANGEDVTRRVIWLSENEAIARVEGGLVTGLSSGTLTITAQLEAFAAGAGVDITEAEPSCGANLGTDCAPGLCAVGVCSEPPSCSDRQRNGTESDIDCGGHRCPACGAAERCSSNLDCASRLCVDGQCLAPTCHDNVKNGRETAADCGGPECPGCGTGLQCTATSDCASFICMDGVCHAATCFDAVQNGSETDRDCGGAPCAPCSTGGGCQRPRDCVERVCMSGVCEGATCADGVHNGTESDADCGGSCPPCPSGGGCNTGADCDSRVCSLNTCLAP